MQKLRTDGGKPTFTSSFRAAPITADELTNLRKCASPIIEKEYADEEEAKGLLYGYFSTFGNKDAHGDIIRPGAFTKTLKERKPKVLYFHDPRKPIGVVIEAWEDSKGLFGVIKLNTDTQLGLETYNLYKSGAMDSFSIGFKLEKYDVIEEETQKGRRKAYDIREVRLMEVSAVTFPANEMALVSSVKQQFDELSIINNKEIQESIESADSIDDLIKALTLAQKTPVTDDEVANLFIESLEEKSDSSFGEDEHHSSDEEVVIKSDEPIEDDHSLFKLFQSLKKETK